MASLICVRDGDLAGIFELATAPAARGRGHARRLLTSALSWAQRRGARQGWLQVEADNSAGCRLYGSLGWTAVYRYHYRQAAEGCRILAPTTRTSIIGSSSAATADRTAGTSSI